MAIEEPTTVELTKIQLDIDAGDNRDDERLAPIVAAANGVVRGLPVAEGITGQTEADPDADPPVVAAPWPPTVRLGASLLAARLWKRSNSPGGTEKAGTDALSVAAADSTIAMLLQLGDYAKPAAG